MLDLSVVAALYVILNHWASLVILIFFIFDPGHRFFGFSSHDGKVPRWIHNEE
jgi:hypothetical protein